MEKSRRFLKKENVKSFFESVNAFEIGWLSLTVFIMLTALVFMPDLMLEDKNNIFLVICSCISIIASPLCEILISKQSRYWAVFSLFFIEFTDTVVFLSLGLYSSVVINILFWVPIDILSFIKWGGKNKDTERGDLTKVKRFKVWQDFAIFSMIIAAGFLFGFILSKIPNNEITYILAFANVFDIATGIFLLTRYNEQWIASFGYLVCQSIVYIMLGHYIMLITIFAMLINTVYGFVKWTLYTRKEDKKNKKILKTSFSFN